jgi:hypothetical protein
LPISAPDARAPIGLRHRGVYRLSDAVRASALQPWRGPGRLWRRPRRVLSIARALLEETPMSFLKSLFGRREPGEGGVKAPAKAVKEIEHRGFLVRAEPFQEGGQYQTAGSIKKVVDGETKVHRFIRADRFASAADAADHAIRKGCQIVDEQGERMFR